MSGGRVESLDDYKVHLGILEADVVRGTNAMQPIGRVYDEGSSSIVDTTRFKKAFAGVESAPGSGNVHTILLDAQGRAWAMGSNGAGQLCLGDDVEKVMIPERVP